MEDLGGEELLRRRRTIELVVLVYRDQHIPSATEPLRDDYKIAGAELDELRRGAFGVGLHLPFEEIARLFGVKLEKELSYGTTPPTQQQLQQKEG